jgi:hypothetical protein
MVISTIGFIKKRKKPSSVAVVDKCRKATHRDPRRMTYVVDTWTHRKDEYP